MMLIVKFITTDECGYCICLHRIAVGLLQNITPSVICQHFVDKSGRYENAACQIFIIVVCFYTLSFRIRYICVYVFFLFFFFAMKSYQFILTEQSRKKIKCGRSHVEITPGCFIIAAWSQIHLSPTHFSYYAPSFQTYLLSYGDIQYKISNLLIK